VSSDYVTSRLHSLHGLPVSTSALHRGIHAHRYRACPSHCNYVSHACLSSCLSYLCVCARALTLDSLLAPAAASSDPPAIIKSITTGVQTVHFPLVVLQVDVSTQAARASAELTGNGRWSAHQAASSRRWQSSPLSTPQLVAADLQRLLCTRGM